MTILTIEEFKDYLAALTDEITFSYNDCPCGIVRLTRNKYGIWYDDSDITVKSVEALMNTRFFDGKSLIDIWGSISDLKSSTL